MITKEYLKSAIENADYNFSGNRVDYTISEVKELSEEGAYLVFAESEEYGVKTSFVAYEDGTCYFLADWQGSYPATEDEIAEYDEWVTEDFVRLPVIFNGLPRML